MDHLFKKEMNDTWMDGWMDDRSDQTGLEDPLQIIRTKSIIRARRPVGVLQYDRLHLLDIRKTD
jgi:hypothetical protein